MRWRPETVGGQLVALVAVTGGSYSLLVGFRWDYYAHFLTGAGLALGLLVLTASLGTPMPTAAAVAVGATLGVGLVGELWWFGTFFRDWADIGMSGLGAALLVAFALGRPLRRTSLLRLAPAAALLVLAGVVARYGFDEVGGLF